MKKPFTDLHELIHSLCPAEKRYIRRTASRQDTFFLQLFDAIAKQEIYDEALLRKKYKSAPFIKNLAVNKKYLYEYMLNALVQFRKKEEEYTIIEGMSMSQVLIDKELEEQGEKKIIKLKEKAKKIGLYSIAHRFLEMQRENCLAACQPDESHSIYHEGLELQRSISNIHEYWNIYIKSVHAYHNEDQNTLGQLKTSPLLKDASLAHTTESQLYFHRTKSMLSNASGDLENAKNESLRYLNVFEKSPNYLSRFLDHYLKENSNYLTYCLALGKNNEFKKGISKFKEKMSSGNFRKKRRTDARVFNLTYTFELNAHLQFNEWEEGKAKLPDLEKGLKIHEKQLTLQETFSLRYLGAYTLFLNSDFKGVMDWVSPLMQFHRTNILQSLLQGSRLINLIAHYEEQNYEQGLQLLKTTRRYIKQSRDLYESEKALFEYLQNIMKAPHLNHIKAQTIRLLDKLMNLKRRPEEKELYKIVNLTEWCERRLLG